MKRTISGSMLVVLILSILTSTFNIQPAKSEPRTWTVDDDGPADFHTIQEAVSAASPEDTILVASGTYVCSYLEISKPIKLFGENPSSTIIEGGVYAQNAEGVWIDGFTIDGYTSQGWATGGCPLCFGTQNYGSCDNGLITNNIILDQGYGALLNDIPSVWIVGSNCLINNNVIVDTISKNFIEAYMAGLIIQGSNNTITHNQIGNETYPSKFSFFVEGNDNIFFHNNIYGGPPTWVVGVHTWDDGYPSGGNYWTDRVGSDNYSGVYQNETGSDGVSDTPYVIDASNTDNYPLMRPWVPYENGTIHIRADGTVDPSGAPIQRKGDIYTLTANIACEADGIVIERDNMTLDGAGYAIQGALSGNGVDLSFRSNVTVKGMMINAFYHGIYLYTSSNNSICQNSIADNYLWGIYQEQSDSNQIRGNNITTLTGDGVGIQLYLSDNNIITENIIEFCQGCGFYLSESLDNCLIRNFVGFQWCGMIIESDNSGTLIVGNMIVSNGLGVLSNQGFGATCYHNNFVSNGYQVVSCSIPPFTTWDGDYPVGGNYWSDYTDVDLFHGPYQNETGSDGIWDHPYNIGYNEPVDNYPLIDPWPSPLGTSDLSAASTDIAFSKSNPSEGQSITISAKIRNLGERNLRNISVRFFDGNESIGEQQISSISHHSQGTASIDWIAKGKGFHLIKVVVDPENTLVEADEENNEATRSILVGEILHFGGIVVNGSATPNETSAGWPVTIQGHAEYNTTYGAGEPVAGADVTITIVGQERQWTTHTTRTGDYATNIVAPYSPGNYTVRASVTDYTFWNSIEIELRVQQSPTGVDLALSQQDISFSPVDPIENDNVGIAATIHNVGTDNAANVLVAFYDNSKLVGNETIDLVPGGGSAHTMEPWDAPLSGWHTIKVVIDPENTTLELRKDNNEASNNIYVFQSLPDLTPTSIDFLDSTPAVNQTITISAKVQNIGGADASDVHVSFYDDNQSIANTTISWIQGKGESGMTSTTHSFTEQGWHLINTTVDIENNINEGIDGEQNNRQCRSIYVHLPSPDLTLYSSDITFSNSAPTVGDIITINATIHNVGEKEAYDVAVKFYDDNEEMGSASIPWIPAGSDEAVGVTWNATPVGWHPIRVAISPLQEELDNHLENNNVATRYISVSSQRPPDLHMDQTSLHSEDIVFSNTNPAPGENVTIYAIVHNIGEAEAQNVAVIFYVDDIQIGWPQTLSSIPAGEDAIVSKNWIATQIGSHVVKVMAETSDEKNRDDNVATRAIIVGVLHDVAVTNVVPSEGKVYEGTVVNFIVTVKNEGIVPESFNVTAFYDANAIETQTNVTLDPSMETTLIFFWNTSGVPGDHRVSAEASILPGETDIVDNVFLDGIVEVVTRVEIPIPGDGDAIVQGNATITKAVVRKNVLHFEASGPSGSIGWVNVTFPMINTTEIKVFINKEKLTPPPFPIITTNGTHYFIYFEFTLSTHEIDIRFASVNTATSNITPVKTVVGQGFLATLDVTLQNKGDFEETFNVTVYANSISIAAQSVTLTSQSSTTITFTWNTNANGTPVPKGNYTISAYVEPVLGEEDTSDNNLTSGWVIVAMIGDITGPLSNSTISLWVPDGKIDARDVAGMCWRYGAKPPDPRYDVNWDITGPTQGLADGKIDARDVSLVASRYGQKDP